MSFRRVVNNYQSKKLNKQFKISDKRLICLFRKGRNYVILHNNFAGRIIAMKYAKRTLNKSLLIANFLCFSKCSKTSLAAFAPRNGESSSTVALAIRSIEPKFRNSFNFLFSPTFGIAVSSDVKSRISRRLR